MLTALCTPSLLDAQAGPDAFAAAAARRAFARSATLSAVSSGGDRSKLGCQVRTRGGGWAFAQLRIRAHRRS
eukprot:5337974-Prymnesium_polylepis.1